MQFICRNLFILITTLICIQHVYSGIIVPRIEEVKEKYSESNQNELFYSIEEKNAVTESDFTAPLASDLVQSFDVISEKGQTIWDRNNKTLQSKTVPEVRELFLGEELKPLNRTRKSNPAPRPTMCFEFSSQNPFEPPTTVCEPIKVTRQTPNDINIVRYNPYMGLPHSSTPLIVLPPYHMSQLNPAKTTVLPSRFLPGYGFQPAEDPYMTPTLHPVPTAQLPTNLPQSLMSHLNPANTTILPLSWLPGYGYQPVGDRYMYPPSQNMALSQLPGSLPPPPMSEMNPVKTMLLSPWPSSYGFQPAENRYMSPPNQYTMPVQLPISPPPPFTSEINPAMTMLPTQWPSRYGFQPVENRYMSPPNQYMSPTQLPASLPLPSMSDTNLDKAMLPSSWPPGYGIQAIEDRYISPSYYHFPSAQLPPRLPLPQMYYTHAPPPAYPASSTPYPLSVYGKINKQQSPHPKKPVISSASKIGLLNTIKEQEETNKVPSPLDEAEKYQGEVSSRSASTYPYIVPQQFPIIPHGLNMAYIEHLAESNAPVPDRGYPSYQYAPSSAMHFTPGQSPSHVPVIAHTAKFGPSNPPAALTCRVHNSEENEAKQIVADDSIAILQLFLKPNPSRHNKYRESAPKNVTNIAGTSGASESAKRPMVQYAETANKSLQDDGLSDVHGSMGKLKEGGISLHGAKRIYEDKRDLEGMKWDEDQEERAMQQYLEQTVTHGRQGVNMPVLQTAQPWAWYQGHFSPSQVPINPERVYVNECNIRQLPYFHPGHWLDQSRVPLQWWGVPQTQLGAPQYRQQIHFLPGQESLMDQELRSKQLLKQSNQEGLHLQGRLSDFEDNPSSESGQRKRNETMEKQTRLNIVKAKLLQRYQSEAVQKRQRARQMSISAAPKDTNNSSRADNGQLSTSFPSMEKRKVSDIVGTTVQAVFENAASRNSSTNDVPRNNIKDENAIKPIHSTTKAVLHDSRPTSEKAKNIPGQAEMPVDSKQIPEGVKGRYSTFDTRLEEFGSTTTGESLGIETMLTNNLGDGTELNGKTSHVEEGSAYGLEGRSSNEGTTTSYENSSYSEEIITYTESSTPRWNSKSQNESFQEENINGDLTRYLEKTVTYAVERKVVPDNLNNTSLNRNQSTGSTSSSDLRRKKGSGEITLKSNSTDVPRVNDISEETFISKNQHLYKENATTVITLENKEISTIIASVDSSDMMTKAPMKFKSETDVSTQENTTEFNQLVSTPEPDFRTEDVFEAQNNESSDSFSEVTDSNLDLVPIKNKNVVSREFMKKNDEVARTSAGKMSRSDILVHSAESNIFHGVNESIADVKKPEKSSSESLFTSEPAASVTTEILAQQRDMISYKQLTSDNVIINSVTTMLPEENTMRSVAWNSSTNDRSENLLSNSTASSHEISSKNKSQGTNSSDSQNYKENSRNNSQISFDSNNPSSIYKASSADFRKSKDFMYDQSKNYASEISFENTELGRGSKQPSKTETQAPTEFTARETSNGTSKMSDEISIISSDDGTSNTEEVMEVPKSLADYKISYRMRSEAEEQSRISGITAAQIPNTSNSTAYPSPINNYVSNSKKNQAEMLGMGRNQKNRSSFTGHQTNSEGGFPQAPNNEQRTGYSHGESIRNFEMNQTAVQSQFKFIPSSGQVIPAYQPPSVFPEATRFLVYPHAVLPTQIPHYIDNERDPGQIPNVSPYSYMFPIPFSHAYSLRSNPHVYSNIPVKNNYEDREMPAERISRPAEKNINGQTIEGKLPFIVVLEQP